MVEEMYKEEFGDSEMSSNLLSENTPKATREDVQLSDNEREESQNKLMAVDSVQQQVNASSTSTTELDRGFQSSDHGANVMDSRIGKLHGDQRFNMNCSPYSSAPIPINQNGGGDGCIMASSTPAAATYDDLSELGNFGHVSLALELRNSESDAFGVSNDDIHKRRNNQTLASSSPDTDLLDYHFTDPGKQQQQHKFGNPHLLHEFVV